MQGLDTSVLPRRDRAEAIVTHMREIALASHVRLEDPPHAFMSTTVFAMGELQLVHLHRSGIFLDVDRERDDGPAVVAMMLGARDLARREQFGHVVEQHPGVVDMIELHRPHRSWNHGVGDNWCLKIPSEALGLPAATITRARPALGTGPLQRIYASHLAMLTELVPELQHERVVTDLGNATLALSRAVISAAAGDEPTTRDAMHASLWPRIEVFVRERLRDPELSPRMIASAHHISVRLLYRVLADVGLQLEQWIIDQRLEGARQELASPASRHRTIAGVAFSWGFANPSFFSSRFHHAYGTTPREWRALHGDGRASADVPRPNR